LTSLDGLDGLPCKAPTFDGSTKLVYSGGGRIYSVALQCVNDKAVTLTVSVMDTPKIIPYSCDGSTCYSLSDASSSVRGDIGGVSCEVSGGTFTPNPGGPPTVAGNTKTCSYTLQKGSTIVLTTNGAPTFQGWTGDCQSAGTNLTCTLTLDGDKTVGAVWVDNS
jgi:hypothetical protein